MNPTEDTRELLLKAAKAIFAERGFDGATVKEIAAQAGVNISLVSYHFDGKEGLYRACFEQFGKRRLEASERLLAKPTSVEDFRLRLSLFIEEFFLWNLEEPDACAILHRECVGQMPLTKDIFRDTFMRSFQMLAHFFEAAQQGGIVRKDCEPLLSTGMFYGSLIHMVRTQAVAKEHFGISIEDPETREKIIHGMVENLFNGIAEPNLKGKSP